MEGGAKILGNASVQGTVLLPGAQVPQGCRVMDCIIGFDAVLPSGTAVERRMVTPTSTTAEPRAEDSVVSGLVFSPLRL